MGCHKHWGWSEIERQKAFLFLQISSQKTLFLELEIGNRLSLYGRDELEA